MTSATRRCFFALRDARLLVAFTGLAALGEFQTARWLASALSEAARPDLLLRPCIDRLVAAASDKFQTLRCHSKTKRLSIVIAGYWLVDSPPRWCWLLVSNFERNGIELPEAQDRFELTYRGEIRPFNREPHFAFAAGMKTALNKDSLSELANMLRLKKPAQAAVAKAVDAILAAAASPRSRGTIGSQCNSAFMLRGNLGAVAEYHSATVTNQIYMPDSVIANGRMGLIARGARIEAFDSNGNPRPLVIPKVRQDAPCPCGSRRKFKHCHGAKQ
jgi:hypothetical protein